MLDSRASGCYLRVSTRIYFQRRFLPSGHPVSLVPGPQHYTRVRGTEASSPSQRSHTTRSIEGSPAFQIVRVRGEVAHRLRGAVGFPLPSLPVRPVATTSVREARGAALHEGGGPPSARLAALAVQCSGAVGCTPWLIAPDAYPVG